MIGNKIKGNDLDNKPCTGVVLDKVRCLQFFNVPVPGGIGQKSQPMPVPLDAYLVLDNNKKLHLVPPACIDSIDIIKDKPNAQVAGSFLP